MLHRGLTKQRHQQRRLPRASSADDQVDFAVLEDKLVVHAEHERPFARSARGLRRRRVLRPGERRVADADSVLVLGRHVRQDLGGLRILVRVELVDELRLV